MNITDDQIRELMVRPGIALRDDCLVALTDSTEVGSSARKRCALRWVARDLTEQQVHKLHEGNKINHATWANAILHPETRLGMLARAHCAVIVATSLGLDYWSDEAW